ncbi:MAG: glycosyltransferase family 4 protein [Acidimicrobiales bacterium]
MLIVTVVYEPDTVSTATIATRLAQELRDLGHDVGVLSSVPHYNASQRVRADDRYRGSLLRPIRLERENGVRVVRCYIPQKPVVALRRALDFFMFHILLAVAVVRHFRDREVTIVISPPFTLALIGMVARALGRGRLVYNVQELWPDVPRDLGVIRSRALLGVLGAVERWVYRSSDRVVAIGPAFARTIVDRGAGADRTSVIPNFVDTERIAPRDKTNPLAAAWGFADKPVVLYAGNIGLTQDFETLLRTAALLEDRGVQFLIVGGGAARSRLEEQIGEARLANVSLRDFVPAEHVSDLYGLADVVVVPLKAGYDRTTTPSKIFSAMAAARPLVACAAPDTDLAQAIAESKAGLVVPPASPGSLAEAILMLLDGGADGAWDPSAALKASRQHSPTAIAARYDEVLRSLVPMG